MRPLLSKPAQAQMLLSALFVAALSFITLAASFAEMPVESAPTQAGIHE
ncbi:MULTISPECIES: hypothetical protein [unclassified Devosia]|nr:hypothetical protein [Devosia sp.]MCR6633329.1 hypothetical protein [Devosia sp.]